jgi:hypothetical protein
VTDLDQGEAAAALAVLAGDPIREQHEDDDDVRGAGDALEIDRVAGRM